MKTIKKLQYVAPTLEVVVVELEEGIAGGSGPAGVSNSPSTSGWGDGPGDTSNGEAF